MVMDIFQLHSVIDIGCGQGTWLKTAIDLGLSDLIGVDGDWARSVLSIPAANFHSFDVAAPFDLGRKFDLAMSMETGEHIAASSTETFLDNIVRHSDAVLFSAAIPFQGGIHHVNERWPSYWTTKFAARNYRCFDFLRWRVWNDDRIEPWYRQNVLIFANTDNRELIARLESHSSRQPQAGLAVVHPDMWNAMMDSKSFRLQRLLTPAVNRLRALRLRAHQQSAK